MYKSPYPLDVEEQTNGDFIISDEFLFWKKEIRIKPSSDKVRLTIQGLFNKKVVEVEMSELVARTSTSTVGSGLNIQSCPAGVLCINGTEILYTKANSSEAVLREFQSLNEQLNNKLNINDRAGQLGDDE